VYLLVYRIHSGFFLAENDADGRRSFAAAERSMPDRLLGGLRILSAGSKTNAIDPGLECQVFADRGM
jgi:hypothetical protein